MSDAISNKHLDWLEAESIYIIREVIAEAKNPALLFSGGKDSVVLLALAVVAGMTPVVKSPWWQESTGAGVATVALKGLKPVLPEDFGKYLP